MIRHKSHNKPDINHSPYFISYVVGEPDKDFFFSTDGTRQLVLLLQSWRPLWQSAMFDIL